MRQLIKTFITSIFLFSLSFGFAQGLPDIRNTDYGFTKKVTKVEAVCYNLNKNPIQTVVYQFNEDGFIKDYYVKNLKDSSWEKIKSYYKNDRLYKRVFKHSNAKFNKKHYYTYDEQGRLSDEHISLKNGNKDHVKFEYLNDLLHKISSNVDETVITHHYTQKGHLFKKVYAKKQADKPNVVSNHFYLENKEIFSYTEPKNHYKAYIYNENVYIGFELIDDERVKSKLDRGIQRFNQEAPKDNLPFNLQKHCNQTWQFYDKNLDKVIPFEIKIYKYKKDASGNKIKYAEAIVNIKTKTISSVSFYKTTFNNNSVVGSTVFDKNLFSEFKEDIKFINIP
ncbi:hypothetical protein BWZ22_07555 [Seonamhaeicola sp. S2-3]|uniref:hypothetical protein n=1 Tax=Seonamhaeicola sp. S2-3 TaxID=1936081 RepID=UPI0009729049|nr:hypothetical protein [Seonamhaeicola sp. S2-3]APY11106.1 hypothetical protein BWZ22_07555 [Seonamhaeicola sp. S2-3]